MRWLRYALDQQGFGQANFPKNIWNSWRCGSNHRSKSQGGVTNQKLWWLFLYTWIWRTRCKDGAIASKKYTKTPFWAPALLWGESLDDCPSPEKSVRNGDLMPFSIMRKGCLTHPKRMNFRKSSKRPLTPPSPLIFGKSCCGFFIINMVKYMQGGTRTR